MTSYAVNESGAPLPQAKTLLVHIVDHMAKTKPQALYAEFPISSVTYDEGFRKVTYKDFANAINGIAWCLHDNLGVGRELETLAYIGPNNFIYPSLILGATKAGYKVLLLSPRNSVAAQLELIRTTKCRTFITAGRSLPSVAAILATAGSALQTLEIPTIENLLTTPSKHYPYDKSFDDVCDEPLVVMHTSGSTGFPKPISWTHGFCAAYATSLSLSPPLGFESVDAKYEGNRIFVMFPPFHAAYIAHVLVNGISFQSSVILPLQAAIPSAQSLSGALKNNKIDAAFVAPSILEEMSKSPEILDHISANLDTVVLPLVRLVEDITSEDWKYLHIHPEAGVEFRPYKDAVYELFIVRERNLENHQPIFKTFPDLQEYQTRDLFVAHPSKPNRWSHYGRSDDIIVLVNGEKTYPVPTEQHILSSHREISGVIVAGSQRFQTALLLEVTSKEELTPARKLSLVETIWPSIEEANEVCPAHARVARSHILFVPSERPMIRTPKGTIMRAASLAQYEGELGALYETADQASIESSTTSIPLVDPHNFGSLISYLKHTSSTLTGLTFDDEDNFFINGMDSLQALLFIRNLKRVLNLPQLVVNDIYSNSSLTSLARVLQRALKHEQNVSPSLLAEETRVKSIEGLLAEYFSLIDCISPLKYSPVSLPVIKRGSILLTGSTGGLGCYILQNLLTTDNTEHVYCLNRSADSRSLQTERNKSRDLITRFPEDRVTFLSADLSKPKLGLEDEVYNALLKSVTRIIHNSWPVNFHMNLSSYHPHLLGVVNLAKFASEASMLPTFLYVSSVSAVSNFASVSGSISKIPEKVIYEVAASESMGYGESKYLSERILDYASKRIQLQVNIARVGQICGPIKGPSLWSRNEWFPSLMISSSFIGAIPYSLGSNLDRIDWIPVDALSEILLELCEIPQHGRDIDGATVFNVLNPYQAKWEDILPTAIEALSSCNPSGGKPEKLSLESWVRKVEDTVNHQSYHSTVESNGKETGFNLLVESNPAIKLIHFYRAEEERGKGTEWETGEAQVQSETLRKLGKIENIWMEKWIKVWINNDSANANKN
ncbi:putative nrps-like enzyme protein [Botrytis fragariae]|uniref:Putative nrps-like enzyme protein n=1 Tax=Botrytis fragariae TaxID=1964551 RepID=A0A8H6ANZ2_9HELO|nr:putative nrps-like enzyme protein [Botrytis fragariae]KAF5870715.1 putative nrps-like enzyme protein [Botrytis fragariae]